MGEKIKVGAVSDIAEGTSKVVEVNGVNIAVFNVGSNFYAIANDCTHKGGPLGEGVLSGETVTCPWHAWEFDIKTGECATTPGANVQTFKTSVVNGELFVEA